MAKHPQNVNPPRGYWRRMFLASEANNKALKEENKSLREKFDAADIEHAARITERASALEALGSATTKANKLQVELDEKTADLAAWFNEREAAVTDLKTANDRIAQLEKLLEGSEAVNKHMHSTNGQLRTELAFYLAAFNKLATPSMPGKVGAG